jgi:hypothetical protein
MLAQFGYPGRSFVGVFVPAIFLDMSRSVTEFAPNVLPTRTIIGMMSCLPAEFTIDFISSSHIIGGGLENTIYEQSVAQSRFDRGVSDGI